MPQRVETFVVGILHAQNKQPCGTGFVVSDQGLIVTAYHVIQRALDISRMEDLHPGSAVYVHFPQISKEKKGLLRSDFSSREADIAVLEVDQIPPEVSMAILGPSLTCAAHLFVSLGYRRAGGGAVGLIAPPEPEARGMPYARLLLQSEQIDQGMSGAPVLDVIDDRVVGMVIAIWSADPRTGKDHGTAYAAPTEAILNVCSILHLVPTSQRYLPAEVGQVLHNLPSRTAYKFVGRKEEMNSILEALSDRSSRVLIAGLSGVGKTALALQIAHTCLEKKMYQRIIWISADEASMLSSDRILDIVAGEFDRNDLRQLEEERKKESVLKLLRSFGTLLIVDGFKETEDKDIMHLIMNLPDSTATLITSRHRRVLAGEVLVLLRPLEEEEALTMIRSRSANLRLEMASEADLIMLQEATGGLPLAIEWAVGQINTGRQSLEDVLSSLTTARDERIHKALFENSFRRLNSKEKMIVWALSLFAGSASKQALHTIADVETGRERSNLEELIGASFVRDNGEFTDKKVRYNLHPLIKAFVYRRLTNQSPSILQSLRERYMDFFHQYTRERVFQVKGARQGNYQELEEEADNIRVAMNMCQEDKQWTHLVEFVVNLNYFLFTYGYWHEAVYRGNQAIKAAQAVQDRDAECWLCINQLGYTLLQQGKYEDAEQYILRGLELMELPSLEAKSTEREKSELQADFDFEPTFVSAIAHRYLGILYSKTARHSDAEQAFSHSLQLFQQLGRRSIIANQKTEMGDHYLSQGQYARARKCYMEALEYHMKQQHEKMWVRSWMAKAYNGLARVAFHEGRLGESEEMTDNAYRLASETNARLEMARSRLQMAQIKGHQHDRQAALQILKEVSQEFEQIGYSDEEATCRLLIKELGMETAVLGGEVER